MENSNNRYEFDPGFGDYVLAFQSPLSFMYSDINKFKNLSQKKTKFMQYHKKIFELFYNNVGFYTGCLMWAAYIKKQQEGEIISNPCLGQTFSEEDDLAGIRYLLKFTELFPKDMKYFLGQTFTFDDNVIKTINAYEEFLISNKGFTETKTNKDLKIPDIINTERIEDYKPAIDNAIKNKDLTLLIENIPVILK